MRPDDRTTYTLARSAQDYAICRRMAEARGDAEIKLSYPTIIARRDGRPIGFISTYPTKRAIVVGKLLVTDVKQPLIIAMRLGEAYELILRASGCTTYFCPVSKEYPKLIEVARKFYGLFSVYHDNDHEVWFRRDLDGRRRTRSPAA